MLQNIRLRNIPDEEKDNFPWTLPLIKDFESIRFDSPISFFVGENGSGKSTMLEGIAAALKVPVAGSGRLEDDPSLSSAVELGNYLTLKFSTRFNHGLLARAEDFVGFARKVKSDIKALEQEYLEALEQYKGGDFNLTRNAILGEKNALLKRYGVDLEAMSHGEGFLKLFNARITGRGIYLIDEPEAALSPIRQLSLISLLVEKVKKQGAQFIIATHSPIIMSTPQSSVYHFRDNSISQIDYRETEHYKITKSFLENPEAFLKHL